MALNHNKWICRLTSIFITYSALVHILTYRVEILSARYRFLKQHGGELVVENTFNVETAKKLEAVVANSTIVTAYAWGAQPLGRSQTYSQCVISNVAKTRIMEVNVIGVSSNFFEASSVPLPPHVVGLSRVGFPERCRAAYSTFGALLAFWTDRCL